MISWCLSIKEKIQMKPKSRKGAHLDQQNQRELKKRCSVYTKFVKH